MTNSIGSATLFGLGDVLAQQGVEKKGLRNHDWLRTGRLSFYGGCVFAPLVTVSSVDSVCVVGLMGILDLVWSAQQGTTAIKSPNDVREDALS